MTSTIVARREAFTISQVYTPVTFYSHSSWTDGEMFDCNISSYYSFCDKNKNTDNGSRRRHSTALVEGWLSDGGCYYIGRRDDLRFITIERVVGYI